MLKNYIKIAWRNLWKNKGYSAINIIGLSIGMTAVLIIGIWIQNQFQFENFYSNNTSLYKLWNKYEDEGKIKLQQVTSGLASPALEAEYPEVEHAARIYWSSNRLLSFDEKKIKSKGNEVDPAFIQMFDFKILRGNNNNALGDNKSIVLTESLARNIFGDVDPLDKIVMLDDKEPCKVTAVIADLPSNTNFDFTYLIPLAQPENYSPNWTSNSFYTFVQLKKGVDIEAFNEKLIGFITKKTNNISKGSLFLYPLSKMHLYSKFEQGIPVGGKIDQVKLIGGIGLLILLIACINFINLSTARSQKRAKEVAVRKVVGAQRFNLIAQFLTESVLLALISGLIAIGMAIGILPLFNKILDRPLSFSLTDPIIWISLAGFTFFTGTLAGLYPAFVLSAFKPVKTLKPISHSKKFVLNFRELLVIFQFGIAIILIIATMIVRQQINYAAQRDIGYNSSQLIEIPMEGNMEKNYEAIKSELISAILLNEAAIREMNLKNPVGNYLKWGDKTYTIVGVINDHISGSPYNPVSPLLISANKNWLFNMVIRVNVTSSFSDQLNQIEKTLKKFNPAYPFEYKFVDQQFASKFGDQQQTAKLAFIFSLLAISISCLGLFGLASYMAELKTKEIGIRKVLGASVSGITAMLSRDFVKLVVIAILIASPIAWWAMNKWLQDFSYRIEIQWWTFSLAGASAILIALITVSSQAIRAASSNPVKALRDE